MHSSSARSRATRTALLTIPVWAPLLLGCAQALPQADAAGTPGDAPVAAARIGDEVIPLEAVDERISGVLSELREREYDARRDALDQMIEERLFEKEAAARGISAEQLVAVEVDAKTAAPSPVEVEGFYEANRARIDQPRDQALPRIEQLLLRGRRAERRRAFRDELKHKAGVELLLEAPRTDVPIPAGAPALGPESAPVTMVEFTDYQCPYCKRAQQTVDQVLEKYQGRIRLVYRDLPLDMHTRAFPASRAVRCAGEQGRFWDYHRNLLLEPGSYDDDDFRRRAARFELDAGAFSACLASDRHDAAIRASLADANGLGITATPTFFVNGRRLTGAQPLEEFVAIIDEELARSAG